MKKIALFGTSADPPTVGHQTILLWLAQHYDRVVVWASDNPFKQHQTPLEDRTAMLNIAIADLAAPHHNIYLHPELSDRRTIVTVKQARSKWGTEVEFTLVIGSDILPQITKWYRSAELLTLVKVLVVPRLGYNIQSSDLDTIEEMGGKYAIATLNAPQVSSSSYRLQQNQSFVSPAVRNYIEHKKLYNVATEITSNQY
ncbi:MAG: nicotinate-nucleotide adenylyltransferase [Cyanobacteria bacterium J06621_8]